MALNSINTNVAAYSAQSNINKANSMTSSAIGRLSSGSRIVRASDDVAAMSVGTSLKTTVSTLKVGLLNASQGTSMLQVADGALGKMQDMLLRQKALATQAASGSLTGAERGFLNQEFQNLTSEIDRLVETTNFNGVNLLGGTLGNAAELASTPAVAAAMVAGTGFIASTTPFEAFNVETGAAASTGGTAGNLEFVDGDGTALAGAGFDNVNKSVYGSIGKFEISNLVDGVSATLSTTINGVEFSGSFADDDTVIELKNGNTRIEFGTAAFNLDSSATANASLAAMNTSFEDVVIMQTSTIKNVNWGGALEGVTGNTASSAPMLRLSDMSDTSIKNFQYVSNTGANTNILSVEVGGKTFYATAVNDAVADGNVLTFTNGAQESLQIDLTGLDTDFTNIRTDVEERATLTNALNEAFSNVGGGVDFALGTEVSDKLTVSIGKADSNTLFGNMSLNIATVSAAQEAGEVLNSAIDMVTSIRADVGATMSRFDFATANIEISMQNQDAARGNLMDTDVAAESSAYATAQVQLQAGIAVLAQANQLPQNLLKLIG